MRSRRSAEIAPATGAARTCSSFPRTVEYSGTEPAYVVRYTVDGSEPGPESPRYEAGATVQGERVRAALLAQGCVVVTADERTPKFRIRGSAPPESRDPFRHG
jgi:hypothetical protein